MNRKHRRALSEARMMISIHSTWVSYVTNRMSIFVKEEDGLKFSTAMKPDGSFTINVSESVINRCEDVDISHGIVHNAYHIMLKHPIRHKDFANKTAFGLAADLCVAHYVNKLVESTKGRLNLGTYPMFPLWSNPEIKNMFAGFDMKAAGNVAFIYSYIMENSIIEQIMMMDQDMIDMMLDDHESWYSQDSYPSDNMFETQVDNIVGDMPADARSAFGSNLGDAYKPKEIEEYKVSWREQFQMWTQTAGSADGTKSTSKRLSRRKGIKGAKGRKTKKNRKIKYYMDSSGSMSGNRLDEIIAELGGIHDSGIQVDYAIFDTEIIEEGTFDGTFPDIPGHGGTDFDAAMDDFIFHEEEYDGMIIATDGYAPRPTNMTRKPFLWLITTDSLSKDQALEMGGDVIMIPDNEK